MWRSIVVPEGMEWVMTENGTWVLALVRYTTGPKFKTPPTEKRPLTVLEHLKRGAQFGKGGTPSEIPVRPPPPPQMEGVESQALPGPEPAQICASSALPSPASAPASFTPAPTPAMPGPDRSKGEPVGAGSQPAGRRGRSVQREPTRSRSGSGEGERIRAEERGRARMEFISSAGKTKVPIALKPFSQGLRVGSSSVPSVKREDPYGGMETSVQEVGVERPEVSGSSGTVGGGTRMYSPETEARHRQLVQEMLKKDLDEGDEEDDSAFGSCDDSEVEGFVDGDEEPKTPEKVVDLIDCW